MIARSTTTLGTLAFLLAGLAPGQEVTQILDAAGDGAGAAYLAPRGVARDGLGNLYFAGGASDNVLRMAPDGTLTEVLDASGDGLGNALDNPWALAADAAGNVYVPGNDSHNAFRVSLAGEVTLLIDSTGDGVSPLVGPVGIAVDGAGNAYVAGSVSNNVFRIAPGGAITKLLDVQGDGQGNLLIEPFELVADAAGNLFVGGASSDNVFRLSPTEGVTELIDATGDAQGALLDFPGAMVVDDAGALYVTGYWSNNAFRVAPGGAIDELIDVTGDGQGNPCRRPYGIGLGPTGTVYVAGYTSDNVFAVEPPERGGAAVELVDRSGDGQGNGLNCPLALVVDEHGNVTLSGHESGNAFRIGGAPGGFCDGWDGALAACPCANPGAPDTGCDLAQGTGGVRLDVVAQATVPQNRATLVGTGYPPASTPGVTVLRSSGLDAALPVVFGDGLRCLAVPVVRVGATLAVGGVSNQTVGHGAGPGAGTFHYQLWVRNTPAMYCDPAAAFNLSSGRTIVWP